MLKRLIQPRTLHSLCYGHIYRSHHCTAVPLDDRALIQVNGADAAVFLQGLITNDIYFLKNVNAIYSMLLNARGRIVYDMIIYNNNNNSTTAKTSPSTNNYLIEISRNAVTDLLRLLRMYKLRKQVNISDVTQAHRIWSVFSAENRLLTVGNDAADLRDTMHFKSRRGLLVGQSDPRHANLGVRLITERDTNVTDLTDTCTVSNELSLYKRWLYRHGIAEGTDDIPPGECIPLEYNIVFMNGVSFTKGCYIGQELIARTHHTGVVRKRLMPVRIDNCAELSKHYSGATADLTIIDKQNMRRAGKLRTFLEEDGLALIRLNEWQSDLRIQNADVRIRPFIPTWWPPLDEATQLEMKIDSGTHTKYSKDDTRTIKTV